MTILNRRKYQKPTSRGLDDVLIAEGACTTNGNSAASACYTVGNGPATLLWPNCIPGSAFVASTCAYGNLAGTACSTGEGAG